jgi:hypothetical protein
VRGDVRDDPALASSVCGMPRCPTPVSGRGHRLAGRRASLRHLDVASYAGASMLDRLTRSSVFGLIRLEPVKDVLRARCRPKGQELVIRIGERPTPADRHTKRESRTFGRIIVGTPTTRIRPTPFRRSSRGGWLNADWLLTTVSWSDARQIGSRHVAACGYGRNVRCLRGCDFAGH